MRHSRGFSSRMSKIGTLKGTITFSCTPFFGTFLCASMNQWFTPDFNI
jgi:hypothetical protein